MSDPIIRAKHWQGCYDDGLKQLFADMRQAYFERAAKLPADMPLEQRLSAIESLSIHSDIVASVEAHFIDVISTGKIDEAQALRQIEIQSLPQRKQARIGRLG